MARDRQRSKQRQAERRARRLQQQGGDGQSRADIPGVTPEPVEPVAGPGPPGIDADHLEAGAPPEELGRSDFLLDHDEALVDREDHEAALDDAEAAELAEEEEAYERIEDWELEDPDAAIAERGAGEAGYAVKGRRGREAHEAHRERPRGIQFFIAVWPSSSASSGRTARPWSPSQEWCSASS